MAQFASQAVRSIACLTQKDLDLDEKLSAIMRFRFHENEVNQLTAPLLEGGLKDNV